MECVACWTLVGAVTLATLLYVWSSNKWVRFYMHYVIFIGTAAIIALFCVPLFLLRPFNVRNSLFAAFFGKQISKLLGITWELRHGEILAEDRGAMIIANHQSGLDSLAMYDMWNVMDKMAPVAKTAVFYFWPYGLASWLAGAIFVDRSKPKSANQLLDAAAKLMITDKVKLLMFPEGTRNTSGEILPFKKGAFRIAINAQVPVIPIVISPYYFIDWKNKEFKSGKMVITALPAVPTAGLTMADLDHLMDTTRSSMQKSYNAVAQEVHQYK